MALNKGLLVLFATLLVLSLAHLTLASYSRSSDDEETVPKYKKVQGYGGPSSDEEEVPEYKKVHGYGGPSSDEEEVPEYKKSSDEEEVPEYKKVHGYGGPSDEEKVPKYKRVHGYGGKRFHKKKYSSGYYGGAPSTDGDDSTTSGYYSHDDGTKKPPYNHVKRPSYKKPHYIQYDGDVTKPIYKKPYYKPKPIYSKPGTKPIYTKKPYYKPKPIYSKPDTKPVYVKPIYTKPAYTKPVYEKPMYTEPDTKPVYETPVEDTDPSEESSPDTPVTPYEPEHKYDQPKRPTYEQPKTPAYSSPASSSAAEWLEPHNAARAEVGVSPLVWSDEVAQYAENWARQRQAAGCGMEHSGGSYGENIFWGSGGGYGPAECVASWVREKGSYNYGDNSCSNGDCGHYTQIIWANSARLGCAKAQCEDGSVFMTCNYDPPGNYIGTKPY